MNSSIKLMNIIQFVAVLMFSSFSFTVQSAESGVEPSCTDYLKLNNSIPMHLTYQSCEKGKDAQLRVLIAHYEVSGKYAEQVEAELKRTLKMPAIRFACCGWETLGGYGSFVYQGYNVSVRMTSDESLLQFRNDWPDIPKFYVTATLYLEEP